LDAHAVEIKSKVPFGAKVSDFIIRRSNMTYTLVEIERATLRVFEERRGADC
jgi:hypothetical protein